MTDDRRLIEDFLPLQAISFEASREKSAHNTIEKLDLAKQETMAARFYEIPAEATERVRRFQEQEK